LQQGRIGRPEIRAARGARVVPEGTRRGRPAPEVARVLKRLADQLGADDFAVALDEAAVGALREQSLREARDEERICEPREHRHQCQHHEGRANRSEHVILLALSRSEGDYASPHRTSTQSIAQMPMNGTISPPRPYTSKLRRSRASAPMGRYVTP